MAFFRGKMERSVLNRGGADIKWNGPLIATSRSTASTTFDFQNRYSLRALVSLTNKQKEGTRALRT